MWCSDHAAYHALAMPDYNNLMYEPQELRCNLNMTSEHDTCCEALLAHVFGLPARSKGHSGWRSETSDAVPSRLTTGDEVP